VFIRLEMHQNNIFFIFKKLFLISPYQNDIKKLKKKLAKLFFSKFEGMRFASHSQTYYDQSWIGAI